MYKITIKDATYTIPNDIDHRFNINMIAYMYGYNEDFYNTKKAIEYLNDMGFKVAEVKDNE